MEVRSFYSYKSIIEMTSSQNNVPLLARSKLIEGERVCSYKQTKIEVFGDQIRVCLLGTKSCSHLRIILTSKLNLHPA